MESPIKQELLRKIPSVNELLESPAVAGWLAEHPRSLVVDCVRQAVEQLRRQILSDDAGRCGAAHVQGQYVLEQAQQLLLERSAPQVRPAINATGIILHTGLGRAVWPEWVVDAMLPELKGYVSLAIDRHSGQRSDRDGRVEPILTELTGAQAGTLVNNNAAATMLALAALAAGKEVIVSRGQLIEIGGAFRLPDVLALSGARLVEVGTTNRTHLRDYEQAITEHTAAILRVHPSNYRIVGFTAQPELAELAELTQRRGLVLMDDLGAGALVDLEAFGLPHEPTVQESVAAGADVVLFSADKLIGAGQGGIIVGNKELIQRIRKHPLARAVRIDKSCLMAIERTLMLFRDPAKLAQRHWLYRILAEAPDAILLRAEELSAAITAEAPTALNDIIETSAYLGSGSLPAEELASFAVAVAVTGIKTEELARRLRLDEACVVGRIEDDRVLLDVRAMTDQQVPIVAAAVARAVG